MKNKNLEKIYLEKLNKSSLKTPEKVFHVSYFPFRYFSYYLDYAVTKSSAPPPCVVTSFMNAPQVN